MNLFGLNPQQQQAGGAIPPAVTPAETAQPVSAITNPYAATGVSPGEPTVNPSAGTMSAMIGDATKILGGMLDRPAQQRRAPDQDANGIFSSIQASGQ